MNNVPIDTSNEDGAAALLTRQTVACAVSLGVDIIRSLTGDRIQGHTDINDNEAIAAALVSELKL